MDGVAMPVLDLLFDVPVWISQLLLWNVGLYVVIGPVVPRAENEAWPTVRSNVNSLFDHRYGRLHRSSLLLCILRIFNCHHNNS